MIKVLLGLWLFTMLTGVLLIDFFSATNRGILWGHLLLGFLFAVCFGLFIESHLNRHRHRIWTKDRQFISGSIFLSMVSVSLFSGFLIYLYGGAPMKFWTPIHLGSSFFTIPLAGAHIIIRQKKQGSHDAKN